MTYFVNSEERKDVEVLYATPGPTPPVMQYSTIDSVIQETGAQWTPESLK